MTAPLGPTLWPNPAAALGSGALLIRQTDVWILGASASVNNGVATAGVTQPILGVGRYVVPAAPWVYVHGPAGFALQNPAAGANAIIQADGWQLPYQGDPATWKAPIRYLRYRCEYETQRTAAAVPLFTHGFYTTGDDLAGGVNVLGYELAAGTGIGPNVVLRKRTTFGGAITTVVTTPFLETDTVRWSWDYLDGPVKTLVVAANGVALATITGVANFPNYGVGYQAGENYGRFRVRAAAAQVGICRVYRCLYEQYAAGGW